MYHRSVEKEDDEERWRASDTHLTTVPQKIDVKDDLDSKTAENEKLHQEHLVSPVPLTTGDSAQFLDTLYDDDTGIYYSGTVDSINCDGIIFGRFGRHATWGKRGYAPCTVRPVLTPVTYSLPRRHPRAKAFADLQFGVRGDTVVLVGGVKTAIIVNDVACSKIEVLVKGSIKRVSYLKVLQHEKCKTRKRKQSLYTTQTTITAEPVTAALKTFIPGLASVKKVRTMTPDAQMQTRVPFGGLSSSGRQQTSNKNSMRCLFTDERLSDDVRSSAVQSSIRMRITREDVPKVTFSSTSSLYQDVPQSTASSSSVVDEAMQFYGTGDGTDPIKNENAANGVAQSTGEAVGDASEMSSSSPAQSMDEAFVNPAETKQDISIKTAVACGGPKHEIMDSDEGSFYNDDFHLKLSLSPSPVRMTSMCQDVEQAEDSQLYGEENKENNHNEDPPHQYPEEPPLLLSRPECISDGMASPAKRKKRTTQADIDATRLLPESLLHSMTPAKPIVVSVPPVTPSAIAILSNMSFNSPHIEHGVDRAIKIDADDVGVLRAIEMDVDDGEVEFEFPASPIQNNKPQPITTQYSETTQYEHDDPADVRRIYLGERPQNSRVILLPAGQGCVVWFNRGTPLLTESIIKASAVVCKQEPLSMNKLFAFTSTAMRLITRFLPKPCLYGKKPSTLVIERSMSLDELASLQPPPFDEILNFAFTSLFHTNVIQVPIFKEMTRIMVCKVNHGKRNQTYYALNTKSKRKSKTKMNK